MNMREKIARAIYEKRNGVGSDPWGNRPDTHKLPYLVDADAALDALMEPTEGMMEAGEAALPYYLVDYVELDDLGEAFQAMIRAAKEGK